jgi:modulator of FtsH protease
LLLLYTLGIALALLVPGQPRTALGLEIAIAALSFLIWGAIQEARAHVAKGSPRQWRLTPALIVVVPGVILVVGGFSEAIGHGGGLYWVAVGVFSSFVGAVVNAWVLLVEIAR